MSESKIEIETSSAGIKRPFYKEVKYQRVIVLLVLLVGLFSTIAITQRDSLVVLTKEENDKVLEMEDQGFSFAYGTEPSDLGNDAEGFTPASQQQVEELISTVDTNEEILEEEGQDLFELLEYDEWNNSGQLSSGIVEQLINSQEVQ